MMVAEQDRNQRIIAQLVKLLKSKEKPGKILCVLDSSIVNSAQEIGKSGVQDVFCVTTSNFHTVVQSNQRYNLVVGCNVLTSAKSAGEGKLQERLDLLLAATAENADVYLFENLAGKFELVHFYTHVLDTYRTNSGECFDFREASNVEDVLKTENAYDVLYWHVKRTHTASGDVNGYADNLTERDFLDKNQYTDDGVLMYEWMFGEGFISPGGPGRNLKFVNDLQLKPGDVVLDIGSGIGGSPFQMAERGARVLGVDLSSNMVSHALRAASTKNVAKQVSFKVADIFKMQLPQNHFDVIYSRDCFIHIAEKTKLLQICMNALKPGGRMFFTDYGVGEKEFSPSFKEYLAQRHYTLWPLRKYKEAMVEVGFKDIKTIDLTPEFKDILHREKADIQSRKADFDVKFGAEKYRKLVDGWDLKLVHIDIGDHKWVQVSGTKA